MCFGNRNGIFPVVACSGAFVFRRHGIRVAGARQLEMNVRSVTIVVAFLALSTVAGFAQAWTKGAQGSTTWTIPSTPTQKPPPPQPQKSPPAQPLTRQDPPDDSELYPAQSLYTGFNFGGAYQQNATVETTISSGGPPTSYSQNTTFDIGVRGDVLL